MLIVAHAISLDACTRQLVGQPARSQVNNTRESYCYHSDVKFFGCHGMSRDMGTTSYLLVIVEQFFALMM